MKKSIVASATALVIVLTSSTMQAAPREREKQPRERTTIVKIIKKLFGVATTEDDTFIPTPPIPKP